MLFVFTVAAAAASYSPRGSAIYREIGAGEAVLGIAATNRCLKSEGKVTSGTGVNDTPS